MKKMTFLAVASLFPCLPALAEDVRPVRLELATLHQSNSSNVWVQGEIRLQNLAYEKSVKIAYQVGDWNYRTYWTEVPATFDRMSENNEEVWTFSFGGGTTLFYAPIEFAIRYDVNGRTFWDNNCGSNYLLKSGGSSAPIASVTSRSCD